MSLCNFHPLKSGIALLGGTYLALTLVGGCGSSDDSAGNSGSSSSGGGSAGTSSVAGGGGRAGSGDRVCAPGITETCVGPGACMGGQACLPNGSGWGPCECTMGTGGTSDAGG